jgi:hypothetical protein
MSWMNDEDEPIRRSSTTFDADTAAARRRVEGGISAGLSP